MEVRVPYDQLMEPKTEHCHHVDIPLDPVIGSHTRLCSITFWKASYSAVFLQQMLKHISRRHGRFMNSVSHVGIGNLGHNRNSCLPAY
jgi:hypothetical protein